MVTSTWDNVSGGKGGEGSDDVLSTFRAASWGFSCRNAFIRGYLTEIREHSRLTT